MSARGMVLLYVLVPQKVVSYWCCSGRAQTGAHGTLLRVLMPQEAVIYLFCSGRAQTVARGMRGRVPFRYIRIFTSGYSQLGKTRVVAYITKKVNKHVF